MYFFRKLNVEDKVLLKCEPYAKLKFISSVLVKYSRQWAFYDEDEQKIFQYTVYELH